LKVKETKQEGELDLYVFLPILMFWRNYLRFHTR